MREDDGIFSEEQYLDGSLSSPYIKTTREGKLVSSVAFAKSSLSITVRITKFVGAK